MKISKMNFKIIGIVSLVCFAPAYVVAQQNNMNMQDMCRTLSPDMQNFANQLNMNNKMLFCSKFSDSQRRQAMRLTQPSTNGKPKMTPDKSVEKVAADNKITNY